MKQCSKCHENKASNQFYKIKSGGEKLMGSCKKCVCGQVKERRLNDGTFREKLLRSKKRWRENNKEKVRVGHRAGYLRRTYGISQDQYNNLVFAQSSRCAICGQGGVLLFIDHCHETNKIRGLLCLGCNTGIGNFADNTKFLEKAIEYIKKNK